MFVVSVLNVCVQCRAQRSPVRLVRVTDKASALIGGGYGSLHLHVSYVYFRALTHH